MTRPLTRRALGAGLLFARAAHAEEPVDLQLALAVDASGSVSMARFELQRRGYAEALRNPRVMAAIRSGPLQAIAITMFQWTGPRLHVTTVPWMRVHDPASAEDISAAILAAPRALFGGGTSISGAIDYAMAQFPASPFQAPRRVIDISGDGANNNGRRVDLARDEAVAAGVVINGLPILNIEADLDIHYRTQVIGGVGAFMIAVENYDQFGEAILRKLVTEIA